MKKRVEFDEVCQSCDGTGLYVGIGEKDGSAIVCNNCNGTGKYHYVHEYESFITRKKPKRKIERVFEFNPGIVIGICKGKCDLSDFGGMPFREWESGLLFPPKSEMRKFSCPAWWYQIVNYELKPKWDECILAGAFSQCRNFPNKNKCWEKWDKEKIVQRGSLAVEVIKKGGR